MKQPKTQPESPPDTGGTQISLAKIGLISAIAVAVVGMIGTVISSYFSSQAALAPIVIPIQATETAQARSVAQGAPTQTTAATLATLTLPNPAPSATPVPPSIAPSATAEQPAAVPTATAQQAANAASPTLAPGLSGAEYERLLKVVNIELSSTGTAGDLAAMRSYLADPGGGYQLLAAACLQVIGNQRLKKTVYLDMIDDFYTRLVGQDHYVLSNGQLNLPQLKQGIVNAYNEYYGENVTSFQDLVGP